MPTLFRTLTLGATAAIGAVTLAAFAEPAPAMAQVDCRVVETIGNALAGDIRNQMNARVRGTRYEISRRKTLVIHSVDRVRFDGCRMHANLSVTLKRKIRRDATGSVRLGATVQSFTPDRVCLGGVGVEDVSLSRTLGIGERWYRRAANRALPNQQCFSR
ncbi:hypothetical protein [Notoacmeibacter sp. MSK16QG-6]|uniref:hypothetical protein n=1 Tax=Notoacmeibacter sp. MSK16QG-6 TaxID=2957982 RepID=UPI00209F6CDF|nr:hypothetical protein [Notoacmeibacter sp. MSK16QG-6]MCP1198473.1 hypothetical protein [Notoacmeibacter sp. MSK16QG-6]